MPLKALDAVVGGDHVDRPGAEAEDALVRRENELRLQGAATVYDVIARLWMVRAVGTR